MKIMSVPKPTGTEITVVYLSFIFIPVIVVAAVTASPNPKKLWFLPGVNEVAYSVLGDINIGSLYGIHGPSGEAWEQCSNEILSPLFSIEGLESVAFAVDVINRDPNILPNVTLGFIIRDMCWSHSLALATSLSFLPRADSVCDGKTCFNQSTNDLNYISHDVIGVLAPLSSATAVPISTLYGVAQLPLMGYTTTSDELSDKRYHPYFFRVVPPDKFSVKAMLKFISGNGWSYISILYSIGSYGEKAFDNFKENIGKYGICIATSHRLMHSTDYEYVMDDLLENSRARVVIGIISTGSFTELLQISINRNLTNHFIWIGSDSLASYNGGDFKNVNSDPGLGTFTFSYYSTYVPSYFDHLKTLNVSATKNPWLKPIWEYLFDCSFTKGTCNPDDYNVMQSEKYVSYKAVSVITDAITAFARAAHDLLKEKCPNARGSEARACITGKLLREYLKNVSFEGYTGRIAFDKNQDVEGKIVISQFVYDSYDFLQYMNTTVQKHIVPRQIGIYDITSDTITYFNDSISWSHLRTLPRIVPRSEKSSVPLTVPESVCSRPCENSEYKIEKELPCCWECRTCRENERILSEGNTSCERCSLFTWPDPITNYKTCTFIPLTYSKLTDSLPIILTCLALGALVVTVIILIGHVYYRNERVIKAGSRELSLLQLVAIFVGYITVVVFQTKPTNAVCGSIYFMFCMSFAWLYSPLLVKTVRIYRIFISGSKNNRRPRFISPQSQMIAALLLIVFQILLCIMTYAFFDPGARRHQPIWSEKFVELACDLTLPGLASFLTYNLVLVSLCSVFAFKTRKLPDNFNESKFISMCVYTTLVIWLAFIPTYFTADKEFVRVLLLSTALLLNHSVALLFLFVPKLYAVLFLPPESHATATTRFRTNASFLSGPSNRVGPAPTSNGSVTVQEDPSRQGY